MEQDISSLVTRFGGECCLSSKEGQEKVMEGGPWTYLGRVILMRRWETGIAPDVFDQSTIVLWLQLHNLPIKVRDLEIAVKLAKMAGKVVPKTKTKKQLS
ncbi:hypothetical protein QQ045_032306 [Rhodiola kirilowii]